MIASAPVPSAPSTPAGDVPLPAGDSTSSSTTDFNDLIRLALGGETEDSSNTGTSAEESPDTVVEGTSVPEEFVPTMLVDVASALVAALQTPPPPAPPSIPLPEAAAAEGQIPSVPNTDAMIDPLVELTSELEPAAPTQSQQATGTSAPPSAAPVSSPSTPATPAPLIETRSAEMPAGPTSPPVTDANDEASMIEALPDQKTTDAVPAEWEASETIKPERVQPSPVATREEVPSAEPKPLVSTLPVANTPELEAADVEAEATIPESQPPEMARPATSTEGGTSGAKSMVPMKKAEKMNEFTGDAEQKLPVESAAAPAQRRISAPSRLEGLRSKAMESTDATEGAAPVSSPNSPSKPVESASTIAVHPNTALRSVERAQDLMALHASRLRDSGLDSMQVVIKPGNGLHLSLNLQMRDGAVEMAAMLHRGDYQLLNQHWTELQQHLEARGVRLAPLTQTESHPGANSQFSQTPGRGHRDQQPAESGAFAEFVFSRNMVPKPSTQSRALRGWESWA